MEGRWRVGRWASVVKGGSGLGGRLWRIKSTDKIDKLLEDEWTDAVDPRMAMLNGMC